MFYRWHVDMCGPFTASVEGYSYVMVAIEAYSKVLELAPLKDKGADSTAAAFIDMVLCRYGACAEVCSDRGAEWDAAFSDALTDCMVVHRPTAAQHPQANGAAERSIQSVKRSIRKCADSEGTAKDWPKHLPWIRLGYNCSRQQSTKLAPYTLLYGLGPTIPPAIKAQMEEPLDLDDAEAAAAELVQRQALMRINLVMAGDNLAIAQERDTPRYAQVRDGQYLPRVRVFREGDYVYLKPATRVCEHLKGSGLTLDVEPRKLRVVRARTDGSVELIGRDGRRMTANASNLTLCHLPDMDGTIDLSLAYVDDDHVCQGCSSPDYEADMLLCDNCLEGWYIWCLTPPLDAVPPEEQPWLCDKCKAAGVTEEHMQERQLTSALNQEGEEKKRATHPSAVQQRRDARNATMEGRLVKKLVGGRDLWGRMHYRGNTDGRRPYLVVYEDGSEEVCGNQAVARRPGWLQPADRQLPPGVVVPAPSRAVLGAAAAGVSSRAARAPDNERQDEISKRELLLALESLQLPRGLRYLDSFAGDGLMASSLRSMGIEPITSDKTRGFCLQASGLNKELYELVKPDIVISCIPWEHADRLWVPLLRAALSASAIVLAVRTARPQRGSIEQEKREKREKRERDAGYVWKLMVHDPVWRLQLLIHRAGAPGDCLRVHQGQHTGASRQPARPCGEG